MLMINLFVRSMSRVSEVERPRYIALRPMTAAAGSYESYLAGFWVAKGGLGSLVGSFVLSEASETRTSDALG